MGIRQSTASGPNIVQPFSEIRRATLFVSASLLQAMRLFAERTRQRRALAQLNDAQLRDIGLARDDAEAEARKPFWMA